MRPDALARSLTMVGTAGLVYFYFISHNDFGAALAVCVVLGSGSFQYTDNKPYPIPYVLILLGVIGILEFVRGEWLGVLFGTALGLGLPYGVFRFGKSSQQQER